MPVLATITLFYGIAYWNNWFNAIMLVDNEKLYPSIPAVQAELRDQHDPADAERRRHPRRPDAAARIGEDGHRHSDDRAGGAVLSVPAAVFHKRAVDRLFEGVKVLSTYARSKDMKVIRFY